jgi:hypothetical protein
MPRLDNSSEQVIEAFYLEFDEDDPGKTPPVDLCANCWVEWVDTGLEIAHPPYEDWTYYCRDCEQRLTARDDDY